MAISDSLLSQLQTVLSSLHDPDLQPGAEVCRLLGCKPDANVAAIQSLVLERIAELDPGDKGPSSSHAHRVYELLHSRYVLGLSQEETALRLHVSRSTVQRTQREAVHALARFLACGCNEAQKQGEDWEEQMQREIASLETCTDVPHCDVAEVIQGVVSLQSAIAEKSCPITVGYIQPDLVATVHPGVLRQSLITAIGRVTRHTSCQEITVFANIEDGNAQITLVAPNTHNGSDLEAIKEGILLDHAMEATVQVEGGHLFLRLTAPTAGKVTVLVVDDNPDIAEFYRRAVEGSMYAIAHTSDGERLFDLIEELDPQVIVLDVMLPGIDGWELLMQLRENHTTRQLPVIVCSVVREQELALSLGANQHLAKPIDPRALREALNQVLSESAVAQTTRHPS